MHTRMLKHLQYRTWPLKSSTVHPSKALRPLRTFDRKRAKTIKRPLLLKYSGNSYCYYEIFQHGTYRHSFNPTRDSLPIPPPETILYTSWDLPRHYRWQKHNVILVQNLSLTTPILFFLLGHCSREWNIKTSQAEIKETLLPSLNAFLSGIFLTLPVSFTSKCKIQPPFLCLCWLAGIWGIGHIADVNN